MSGGIEELFGPFDENLKLLESTLHVSTQLRDRDLEIEGEPDEVGRAAKFLVEYNQMVREGRKIESGQVKDMLRMAREEPDFSLRGAVEHSHPRTFGKKAVHAKSSNQRRYMDALENFDMVFAIGPGGTGKTYLAVAMAVAAMNAKKVSRIVLVRPAVEAGERLGFLPGTLQEKVDPYLRPLYDALFDLLDMERVDKMLERNVIEIAPLAFMRGRTLNDAFIIMDEAQNTTIEQMKMFLTRMGNNSKAVITGDITQIDLPNPRKSGLLDAINVLDGVEGIRFCHFEDADVVRHSLVQRIVRAYESAKPQQQDLPLTMGEPLRVGEEGREPRSSAQSMQSAKPQ